MKLIPIKPQEVQIHDVVMYDVWGVPFRVEEIAKYYNEKETYFISGRDMNYNYWYEELKENEKIYLIERERN